MGFISFFAGLPDGTLFVATDFLETAVSFLDGAIGCEFLRAGAVLTWELRAAEAISGFC